MPEPLRAPRAELLLLWLLCRVGLFVSPRTVARQASLSVQFSRQEYWSGVVISFSRGCSRPRDGTCVPCIGKWILNHWTIREVPASFSKLKKKKKVYFGIKIAKTSKEKPTPGFPVGKGLDLVEGCLRITNKPISGLRGLRTDGPAKGARLTLPKLWVQRPGIQALNQSFCVLTLMC